MANLFLLSGQRSGFFRIYKNPLLKGLGTEACKLYIGIDDIIYDEHGREEIRKVLNKHLAKGNIHSFKFICSTQEIKKKLNSLTRPQDVWKQKMLARYAYTAQFTIYLFNEITDNNFSALAMMCKEISAKYKSRQQRGNAEYTSPDDVPLPNQPLFYFRQTSRTNKQKSTVSDPDYIPPFNDDAKRFSEVAKTSPHFTKLAAALSGSKERKLAAALSENKEIKLAAALSKNKERKPDDLITYPQFLFIKALYDDSKSYWFWQPALPIKQSRATQELLMQMQKAYDRKAPEDATRAAREYLAKKRNQKRTFAQVLAAVRPKR